MNYEYDLVVIGGGAGGLFAVSVANSLGAKTCLVEKKRLGGDCTWFGCVPSKTLLKSAQVANYLKRASEFGLQLEANPGFQNVLFHVREIVADVSTHHPAEVFEKRGIKVIFGSPHFQGPELVKINGAEIKAKRFIISTGSQPVIPPIEGLAELNYLTNENIFELEKLPESLIVLGGGPIGVELSQALNRLGVKVHLVEMLDRILFREEPELAKVLERRLKDEGVNILTGKKATKFEKRDGRVYVTLEDKAGQNEEVNAENVLIAVGRAPNLEGLNLESAGVEYDKKGIKVNQYLQSTNPKIFACGDVVGPYLFSHLAAYQAGLCVRNALFRRIAWQKVNYSHICWATFTEPELAHLGLTEEEARERYKKVKLYRLDYRNADRAVTEGEKEGMLKVITDSKGIILGAHVVGANAGEIIQGFIIAKSLKVPLHKLSQILYIYPTLSELVKKLSAQALIEKANNPLAKFVIKIMRV